MFGNIVQCMGCGRTDAGVHASQFFCHIDLDDAPDFDFIFRINKMLPDDIVVYELIPVEDQFHSQYSATKRTYDYFIHFDNDPFLAEFSYYHSSRALDFESMQKAIDLLPLNQEYRAFCKAPDVYNNTLCEVSFAELKFNKPQSILRFRISSNRFLRNMIRLIVGNLLEIGSGNLKLEQFEKSLVTTAPLPYFNAAYPHGLYLSEVIYPGLYIPPKPSWFDQ